MSLAQSSEGPDYYSTSQVGSMLGVDQRTVREWIMRRQLTATRFDGHWQIAPSDLEKFRTHTRLPARKRKSSSTLPLADLSILRTLAQWDDAISREIAQVHQIVEGNVRKHLCLLEAQGFARRIGIRNASVVWVATPEGRKWLETQGLSQEDVLMKGEQQN